MGLDSFGFEPVEQHAIGCREASDCRDLAVVAVAKEDGRWHPACFRHAFVAALSTDEEAQRLALGYAVGHAFSDKHVERRMG